MKTIREKGIIYFWALKQADLLVLYVLPESIEINRDQTFFFRISSSQSCQNDKYQLFQQKLKNKLAFFIYETKEALLQK